MADYQWTDGDGNGDFGDAYNWRNEYTFGSGVPGAQDDADINANGTISGSGTVSGLTLEAGGLLTADGLSIAATFIALNYGNIALTDGTNFFASTQTNESGGATVTVSGDSSMTVLGSAPSTAGLDIGIDQDAAAVLDLTGYGTEIFIWGDSTDTDLGDTGIGLMTISAGAELSPASDQHGGTLITHT